MPWFEFTKPFNWDIPDTGQTIAYKCGTDYVKAQCAEDAVAAGRGKVVERPSGAKASKIAPKAPQTVEDGD